MPRPAIKVDRIKELYEAREGIRKQSKAAALACFDRLVKFANAKTLDDLTTDVLLKFRADIEAPARQSSRPEAEAGCTARSRASSHTR
jgi:hypothetical protein